MSPKTLRKLALPLSFACLAVIAALTLSSCNFFDSKKTKKCTGGPYNVVGPWQLTTSGGGATSYGAIDSAGQAIFFDAAGETIAMPTITGACSFTGTLTSYTAPGSSESVTTYNVTGNVNSATSISGSYSGASSGTITGVPFTGLTGAPVGLTGNWRAKLMGAIDLQSIVTTVTFTAPGGGAGMSFTSGTNLTNCTITGTFTQVNTANTFDVSMTFTNTGSGSACAITGTFTGMGIESNTDYFTFNGGATGTYLYANVLASNNTFAMEFYQPAP